jgi:hypothetical protein
MASMYDKINMVVHFIIASVPAVEKSIQSPNHLVEVKMDDALESPLPHPPPPPPPPPQDK